MGNSSELENLRQLLSLAVAHLDALTTQVIELMPLKNVDKPYRKKERETAVSLATNVRSLREAASTLLDIQDR